MARISIKFQPIKRKDASYPSNIMLSAEREFSNALFGPILHILTGAMVLRTLGWKTSPSFGSQFDTRARLGGLTGWQLTVKPSGPGATLWGYVSLGVKARPIVPRRRKLLFIHGGVGGYSPRTNAQGLYAGPGTYNTGSSFYARRVNWPGIEPRAFEADIKKIHEGEIVGILAQAWEAALHG
jgi:hypothetical protein